MGHVLIPASLTSIVILCIGLWVWRKSPRSVSHVRFGLFSLAVAGWDIANGVVHTVPGTLLGTAAARFTFVFAALIPVAFHRFVSIFPQSSAARPSRIESIWLACGGMLSVAALTPLIVVDTTSVAGALKVTYGPLHKPFALFFLGCFSSALVSLARRSRTLTGTPLVQARYLFAGVLIAFVGGSTTNLLLPVLFGTSKYGQLGPLFAAVMFGVIGHTIVRHRLMDIRVVARRSAVYLLTTIAAVVVLISLLIASRTIVPHGHFTFPEVVVALLVAVSFFHLRRLVGKLFDRYMYRSPYDYALAVKTSSRALSETVDLDALSAIVGRVANETLRPEAVSLYLLDDDAQLFVSRWESCPTVLPRTFQWAGQVQDFVRGDGTPLFRDEITAPLPSERAQTVWKHIGAGPIEVLVPLNGDTGLVGLLVLGPKRSGEPYYSDDADLLATLGNHAAVAIRNALAHQRVVLLNEELMKILGTIESGVIAVGANRKVSLFNGAAQELTALPGGSVIGSDAGQLPQPIGAFLEAALRDRASRSQEEFSLPDTAGQRRSLVCSTTPLLSPRGDVVGAVAVLGDLSRLKELEQERRRLERLGSLESIASGLVHEIRNPLLAVKTFAQLMPARHQEGDFRETFSRVTGREIGRIEELLSRFRSLATTSAQPMGPVDIREPIRDALEALHPQIESQRVALRQVADGTPRPIVGNTSQLEQLFLNLCLNALQAMESGGELTVRVADLSEGGGTTVLVEVSDTGPGIPETLLETIFNPFVTTKPGGTGLGLAICRGIADAHQARLSAENHVERPGCTFTLEFPVLSADRARSRS